MSLDDHVDQELAWAVDDAGEDAARSVKLTDELVERLRAETGEDWQPNYFPVEIRPMPT